MTDATRYVRCEHKSIHVRCVVEQVRVEQAKTIAGPNSSFEVTVRMELRVYLRCNECKKEWQQ